MICKFKKNFTAGYLLNSFKNFSFFHYDSHILTFLYAGKVLLNILLFYTFVYICIFYIVSNLVHIPQVRHKFGWFEYFKHVVVSNVCKFRIKVVSWTKINFFSSQDLDANILNFKYVAGSNFQIANQRNISWNNFYTYLMSLTK